MRYRLFLLSLIVAASGCVHTGSSEPLEEFEQDQLTIVSGSGDVAAEIAVNRPEKSFTLTVERDKLEMPEPPEGENITQSARGMLRRTCLRFMPVMQKESRQKGLSRLQLSNSVRIKSGGKVLREEYSMPASSMRKIMRDYEISRFRFRAFNSKGVRIGSCTLEEYGGDVSTSVNPDLE